MEFVAPSLAVGSMLDASDEGCRRRNGIDAVLSLLDVNFCACEHHTTISILDREPLSSIAIAGATAFIDQQLRAGRKVLVHCLMGLSRSPTITAAYLHEYAGMGLGDALAWVSKHRPAAEPHPTLVDSLYRHYALNTGDFNPHDQTLDLSANESPLGPSARAVIALETASRQCHRYPDRFGMALKVALSDQLDIEAGQLVLGNGSCELLDLIARAFLEPGDQALIATPSFLPYRSAIQRAHGEVVEVPLAEDFSCDLERMAEQIGKRTRLVILGHPNNPTGMSLGAAELNRFLDRLPDHVVVLVDEAYCNYVLRQDAADAIALVKSGRPVVAVRTFSKLHALAGLRIGYAAARPDLAARIESIRSHYNTSSAAQAAALASLADNDHIERSLYLNRIGLIDLAKGCVDLNLDYVPSEANFLLVRTGNAKDITIAMAAQRVLVKDCTPFGLPDHIRITVGMPADNSRCLNALRRVMDDYRSTHENITKQGAQAW